MIVNKTTKRPMRMGFDIETRGPCYVTYDVPVFYVEEEDKWNFSNPIFVTNSREIAESVVAGKYDGERMEMPRIDKGYGPDGYYEYEVEHVVTASDIVSVGRPSKDSK